MKAKICFILDWYPTQTNNGCIFAKHLICAMADQGYDCFVITPRIISKTIFQNDNYVPYERVEYTDNGNSIRIFAPFYLHLSSRKQTMQLSMNNHYKAVLKTIFKYKLQPDIVYGHFIYQCGLTAARIGKTLGIPAYCACGENSLRLAKGSNPYNIGVKNCNWSKILSSLSGVICVSSNNRKMLLDNGFITDNLRMGVFPNGIDDHRFYKMDKATCRRQLGFPEDTFIVAFTGAFTENKGADRLNAALKTMGDVSSIFMGQGPVVLDCDNLLFAGRVPNCEVAKYLNAADVFVLPTKGEGCSNAIVEAMACGLPVISSNLPFNDDILNEHNSLRINVEDVDQIKAAIEKLKNDKKLRDKLADGARKTAKLLDINTRANRILKFMELKG